MAALPHYLLGTIKVAVISLGDWPQFERQLLPSLPRDEFLVNLCLLPTCGTRFFQYTDRWNNLYLEDFTAEEKEKIVSSLNKAVTMAGSKVEKTSGEVMGDRESQITFSSTRPASALKRDTLIPEFFIRMGGTTSIDVTNPGLAKPTESESCDRSWVSLPQR